SRGGESVSALQKILVQVHILECDGHRHVAFVVQQGIERAGAVSFAVIYRLTCSGVQYLLLRKRLATQVFSSFEFFDAGGCHCYFSFLGRPPRLPFSRAAACFAADVDLPPTLPPR